MTNEMKLTMFERRLDPLKRAFGSYGYRISSNNSRPSINRLPRIIAPL